MSLPELHLPAADGGPQAPFDPVVLARLAREFFGALPGSPPPGVQSPVNVAPPGSPLVSPAGLAPNVPGTSIAQGVLPGANFIAASPSPLPSLAHRSPALAPHAQAGNGVPDSVVSQLPAYEPRFGSGVTGVPYYFLENTRLPENAKPARELGSGYYFVDSLSIPDSRRPAAFDVQTVRRDFPILRERVHGKQLVWLDNAATTQKPQCVIDRLSHFYRHENSNIHRAAHDLAARATDAYEEARETVRRFINAPDVSEVVFVRGTTEGINLVAKSWGWQHIGAGDEIIVSHLEHHANIVPWQQLVEHKGAHLRVIPVDDSGQLLLNEYRKLINERTKLVAITQVSNALGTVVPVKEVVDIARAAGIRTLVDGAQSVAHMHTDVQDLGADFFVFSGHKIYGPTGIGAVWARQQVWEETPPWQSGGNMIADVTFEKTTFQPIPNKFEAGTGNIADAVGLSAALQYVERIGIEAIGRYEHELLTYGIQHLGAIPGVRLIGTAPHKASVLTFVLAGYSTEEVGQALNREGIAVRAGHHCAQPILRRFGLETTVRPSLAFYNTHDEIDQLVDVVRRLAGQRPSSGKS